MKPAGARCLWGVPVLLALAGAVRADGPRPRGQQLEYDPKTGEFVEAAPPVKGTPEGDLQLARQAFGREALGKAYRRTKKWLKTYGQTHELTPEALLLRAEIQISRRNYYKAHRHLQAFLAEYAGSQLAERAAELDFVIAEVFLSGTKRKLLGMRILGARDTGLDILDELASQFPDSALAESAIKTKADYFFEKGDFSLAELEYSRLAEEFPRSRYVRLAMRRSAEAALASFPGIEFDDAALIEAEERFTQYLAQYADSAEQEGIGQILHQIHSKRAEKEYTTGEYYQRTKHTGAAVFYYRSTCRNWAGTVAAAKAREKLAGLGAVPEPQAQEGNIEASTVEAESTS